MNRSEHILFSWGANSYGQLGLGDTHDKSLPCKVLIDSSQASTIKQITGGGGHTILLQSKPVTIDDGKILVFGWNKNGQCGIPSSDSTLPSPNLLVPHPLPHQPWKVEKVACGWNHTMTLIEGGGIMAWGSNAFGQLGMPSVDRQSVVPVQLPKEVFHDSNVVDISAGLRHSLAVTENGSLFGWGDNKKGQLGLGPKELTPHHHPRHISCSAGKCNRLCAGAYHSIALTVDKELLSWGLNQHGQCGISHLTDELTTLGDSNFKVSSSGLVTNVYMPVRVKEVTAPVEMHCGWSHTLVIADDKKRKVFGWGRADYGQLGQEQTETPGDKRSYVPTEIPRLQGAEQVSCGSEHNIVIPSEVMAFGWNEHGMCGTGNEVDVAMAKEVSGLPRGQCLLLGTGAGHSLVLMEVQVHTP